MTCCSVINSLDGRHSSQRSCHSGFTLTELLVVIVIIMILAGLLLPALRTVKELAKSTKCAASLRQMGVATVGYMADWQDLMPDCKGNGADWATRISPYVEADNNGADSGWGNFRSTGSVFKACANAKATGGPNVGYAMSYVLFAPSSSSGYSYTANHTSTVNSFPYGRVTFKPKRLFISERYGDQNIGGVGVLDFNRHGKRVNALFCDFHVESANYAEAKTSIEDPSK